MNPAFYLLSVLLSVGTFEINIANSVEWNCYEANTVAVVKVTSVQEEKFKLMDYESDATIDATIIQTFKGMEPLTKNIIIYSRLTYIGGEKWKNMIGKEVLVFMKDMICERQCAYSIFDDDYGMINLDAPGSRALTGKFTYLKNKTEINDYVTDCIKKLKGKTAKRGFLEVPFDTEAHGALYAGSSCYLIVPDVLYPKATEGMR